MQRAASCFIFPSVAPALWMWMETQIWKPTGWIIKLQADRRTHRDFHVFGSCFHLLVGGGRRTRRGGGEGGEEEEWHWSSAGKIWFPANNRLPLWAVKEAARRSLFPRTKTWLLTVKERIEEKNVPSSYLESLERTPSKMAANCRQRDTITTSCRHSSFLQTSSFGLKSVLHDLFSLKTF